MRIYFLIVKFTSANKPEPPAVRVALFSRCDVLLLCLLLETVQNHLRVFRYKAYSDFEDV